MLPREVMAAAAKQNKGGKGAMNPKPVKSPHQPMEKKSQPATKKLSPMGSDFPRSR